MVIIIDNFNMIMNNPGNVYFGHGTGTDEPEKLTSILVNGLRCKDDSLYFTSERLGEGNNIGLDDVRKLRNWPHDSSKKIVIVSLPKCFTILDSYSLGTYHKGELAFCYTPSEEQIRNYGLNPGLYIMPEFILGYYDAIKDEFYRSQLYYEMLPDAAQRELFDRVKANYVKVLEDGCGVLDYRDSIKNVPGWSFPLTDEEILKYMNKDDKGNTQVDYTDVNENVSFDNQYQVNMDAVSKMVFAKSGGMKLPNGMVIPFIQYLQEVVFPHLPKDGVVILSDGSIVSVKKFVEEYVTLECQEDYNGDFVRYMALRTRNNVGVVCLLHNGQLYQINPVDIVQFVNQDLLNRGVRLPNGEVITVKKYLQEYYAPHIPFNGMVILNNGMEVSVVDYIEKVLFALEQSRYNGDIGQILYNTTRGNLGTINLDSQKMQETVQLLKNPSACYLSSYNEGMNNIK